MFPPFNQPHSRLKMRQMRNLRGCSCTAGQRRRRTSFQQWQRRVTFASRNGVALNQESAFSLAQQVSRRMILPHHTRSNERLFCCQGAAAGCGDCAGVLSWCVSPLLCSARFAAALTRPCRCYLYGSGAEQDVEKGCNRFQRDFRVPLFHSPL
jgi:hypothetical protein